MNKYKLIQSEILVFLQSRKEIRLLFLCFFFSISCQKSIEVNKIEEQTFLRYYSIPGNQMCSYIHLTHDGGYIILGSSDLMTENDGNKLTLTKVNSEGEVIWTNVLPDTIFEPQVRELNDGSFILTSSYNADKLVHFDANGTVLLKTRYFSNPTNTYDFSYPFLNSEGHYVYSYTNGSGTGLASSNNVLKFDQNGKYFYYKKFHDTIFGGKIYDFNLYRYDKSEVFYFYGLIYLYPFDWANNPRLFISKLDYSTSSIPTKKTVILDPQNKINQNFPYLGGYTYLRTLSCPDSSLVISSFQITIDGTYKGIIYRIDKNLNVLWNMDLRIGKWGTIPKSITLNSEGNYLICGSCYVDGKYTEQPFACTVNSTGKIIWSNIYPMEMNSTFHSGYELTNGSYIFGGTTNGFGNGSTANDVFLMKTNKEGELK